MRIYGCQLDIVWEDKQANFDKVRRMAAAESPEPGSLFVLPEMFATGFSMNVDQIAEDPCGETERFAADLAREHGINVMAGLAAKDSPGKGRNEAVVFSPDGDLICRYSKIQPFAPGQEAVHYRAGDL